MTQCFGSLGGTVELQLTTTSQEDLYKLKRNNSNLYTNNKPTNNNPRYSSNVSTGIFTIKDTNRTDNGQYSMLVYNADAELVGYTECYLTIQGE